MPPTMPWALAVPMTENPTLILFIALIAATGLSVALTRAALAYLRHRAVLDRPNDRSSHDRPVPRGGGLGVVPAFAVVWAVALWLTGSPVGWPDALVFGGLALLAVVGWRDDLDGLGAGTRLLAQCVCVAAVLATLPETALVWQGWVPLWADRLLTLLAWLWVVNLFNFMDGIDGISGMELASVGLGVCLLAAITPAVLAAGISLQAAALAGAALGFLVWNWHPAKLFMGDSGSVPLGFALGWLLVQLAAAGLWLPAVILPAYSFADATLTLIRRGLRGEAVWHAHREHLYQRAVQAGRSHDAIVLRILTGNLALILCTLTVPHLGVWALLPAAAAVVGLLVHFALMSPGRAA